MKKTTVAEFLKNFDHYRQFADAEAIQITDDGKDNPRYVLLPYEVYLQLRKGARKALDVSELPEEWVRSILEAAVDPDDG